MAFMPSPIYILEKFVGNLKRRKPWFPFYQKYLEIFSIIILKNYICSTFNIKVIYNNG
jgi:hypothetical protein